MSSSSFRYLRLNHRRQFQKPLTIYVSRAIYSEQPQERLSFLILYNQAFPGYKLRNRIIVHKQQKNTST